MRISKYFNNNKGVVLPIVIIVMVALSILATPALITLTAQTNQAQSSSDKMQSYYIAKAGADAVAKYILDNPSSVGSLINQTSASTSLSGMPGTFQVKVLPDAGVSGNIDVVSTSTLKSNIHSTVTLVLSSTTSEATSVVRSLNKAVYISANSTMNSYARIEGTYSTSTHHGVTTVTDIGSVNKEGGATITMGSHATIGGNQTTETMNFNFGSFPAYPTFATTDSAVCPGTLHKNTYYTQGLKLTSYSDHVSVTIPDDSDFVVRLHTLEMVSGSSIEVRRNGAGRLLIFVDGAGTLSFNGNGQDNGFLNPIYAGSEIRKLDRYGHPEYGNSDCIAIYYNNPSADVNCSCVSNVAADMYIVANSLTLGKNIDPYKTADFEGTIFFNGPTASLYDGDYGSGSVNRILYAPNSVVAVHDDWKGILVCKSFSLATDHHLDYTQFVDVVPPEFTITSTTGVTSTSYSKLNYK